MIKSFSHKLKKSYVFYSMLLFQMLLTPLFAQTPLVFFYNPDAQIKNVTQFKAKFNQFLKFHHADGEFQPFELEESLVEQLTNKLVHFVICPVDFYQKNREKFQLNPWLQLSVNNKNYYQKVLVSRPDVNEQSLKNKKLATTKVGTDIIPYIKKNIFQDQPFFPWVGIKILEVNKDMDALFAFIFNQADLCLVVSESIDLMKKINPSGLKEYKIIKASKELEYPYLCITPTGLKMANLENIKQNFLNIHKSKEGVLALAMCGNDRLIEITQKENHEK